MFVGEKPGVEEMRIGRPFVGRSGEEQDEYLRKYHLSVRRFYITNLVKSFVGERHPTPDEIEKWTPILENEVENCTPKLIVAVGAVAARYFLGEDISLDIVHGILHDPTERSSHISGKAYVLPIHHPALGFRDSDTRSLINADYQNVAECVKALRQGGDALDSLVRRDPYAGKEVYREVDGRELADLMLYTLEDDSEEHDFAIDTEGDFSLQVSWIPGEAYFLRQEDKWFDRVRKAMRKLIDRRVECVAHNWMHDMAELREAEIEFRRAKLFDTMYWAYLSRTEAYNDSGKGGRTRSKQGLKPLAWRHNGVRMMTWEEVTGGIAAESQLKYLKRVAKRRIKRFDLDGTWIDGNIENTIDRMVLNDLLRRRKNPNSKTKIRTDTKIAESRREYWKSELVERDGRIFRRVPWPGPETISEHQHDGTIKETKPTPIHKAALRIIEDYRSSLDGLPDNITDIEDRWLKQYPELREPVEEILGEFPTGSIREVYKRDPERAIRYGCCDADQTLRLKRLATRELAKDPVRRKLMNMGMEVLPVFEEMQANGMPTTEEYFENLSAEMWDEMVSIGKRISDCYWDGKPFNPGSHDQVRLLLRKRGLTAAKWTASGEESTAQDSIQHLESEDEAIGNVFKWRKHEHIKDKFCAPILVAIRREKKRRGYRKDERPEEGSAGYVIQEVEREDGTIERKKVALWPMLSQILITRTATRRLAGKAPNPLNIPTRTELGRRVREGFVAPEGFLFGAYDLSQIEFRWLAHFSRDRKLLELFNSDQCFFCGTRQADHDTDEHEFKKMDIHAQTASWVFGIDKLKAMEKKYRTPMKTIVYGKVFLQTGFGMASTMRKEGLAEWDDPERCDEFIREIDKLYPGIPRFVESVKEETERTEVAYSYDGMPRYLPGIRSRDHGVKSEALRHAMSQRIQGSAQDMIQRSIAWLKPKVWALQDSGSQVSWLLEQHDELDLMFEKRLEKAVSRLVIKGLTEKHGIEMLVPIEAEGATGERWSDLK
jgi:uracil-DNA glycosylase family 4